MSERAKYINREKKASRRRWPVFLVGGAAALLLSWVLWFFFLSRGQTGPAESLGTDDKNLAATLCRGSDCLRLNKEGLAFNRSGQLSGNIVLSLIDKTNREFKIGGQLIKPETLAELLFLKNQIYETQGVKLLEGEIADSDLVDFNFTTSAGWNLKLTTSENAYKTLEVLKQTLAEIAKTVPTAPLDYIDLRIPNKVYFKFK